MSDMLVDWKSANQKSLMRLEDNGNLYIEGSITADNIGANTQTVVRPEIMRPEIVYVEKVSPLTYMGVGGAFLVALVFMSLIRSLIRFRELFPKE